MDPSKSLADLQTFSGMIQFLSRFLHNLASISAVLWDLTKTKNEFQWHPEHQAAVDHIKQLITMPSSLQYFDGNKPVTIQVDASMRGLGATLLQDNGPVEYRSKLLTETEQRYSNIEREMLAVLHGLEKFHYYAYGRHVIIETDHKPLEAIFKKHPSSGPPRIARMMLRIQKYNIKIKYVPGKEIPLADALSRLNPCDTDAIEGLDVSVNELYMHLNTHPTRIQQIQVETAKDPTLLSLLLLSHT
jgi:ribonuclease HI